MRSENIRSYRYLDFTDILPEDDYLYSEIINISQSEKNNLIINWGRTFPWSIDDRLSLVSHFDEKTINSINNRINRNDADIVPLIPMFGGMEFLLSFPSYLYMRLERKNCSVLNPKIPGAVSIIESIVEDYKSIFTKTETIALDMRHFSSVHEKTSELELERFFSKTAAVLDELVSGIIIFCTEKDKKSLKSSLEGSGFNNFTLAPVKNFMCLDFVSEKDGFEIIDSGLYYFLDDGDKDKYTLYLDSINKIWDNIQVLKKGLLSCQIFEYVVRVKKYDLCLLFEETEIIYQNLISEGDYLAEKLKGKIINDSVCRMFQVNRKVIETELFFLKTGFDNYFIELDNC
jgi:hypothetical protein